MPAIQRNLPSASVATLRVGRPVAAFKKASSDASRQLSPEFYEQLRIAYEARCAENLVVLHVQSWTRKDCIPSSSDVLQLFVCLSNLIGIMRYSFERLLWPTVIYAERYVRLAGPISQAELFPLLVVSASVAVKFWEDCGPDLDLTSFVSGISKQELSKLERTLLKTLDFKLFLEASTIDAFRAAPVPCGRRWLSLPLLRSQAAPALAAS